MNLVCFRALFAQNEENYDSMKDPVSPNICGEVLIQLKMDIYHIEKYYLYYFLNLLQTYNKREKYKVLDVEKEKVMNYHFVSLSHYVCTMNLKMNINITVIYDTWHSLFCKLTSFCYALTLLLLMLRQLLNEPRIAWKKGLRRVWMESESLCSKSTMPKTVLRIICHSLMEHSGFRCLRVPRLQPTRKLNHAHLACVCTFQLCKINSW